MARLAIIAKAMTPRIFQDRFIVYEPAKNPATNCGKKIMTATTDADIQEQSCSTCSGGNCIALRVGLEKRQTR